jgi:hypothetical protein
MNIGDDIRQGFRLRVYHEAGHAVVDAYIGLPFATVSVPEVFGGAGGVAFDTEYDYSKCSQELLIKLAKGTSAGSLATNQYDRLHPDAPFNHPDSEGEQDKKALREIAEYWKPDPPDATIKAWESEVAAILEDPYVWAAVEELARQLEKTQGKRGIREEQVRETLQNAKKQA